MVKLIKLNMNCTSKYTNECEGSAGFIVNFSGIGTDGLPEPGSELFLCGPCKDHFTSVNPEISITVLPAGLELNKTVLRERVI